MMSERFARGAALPKGWTPLVCSALLQAISLAATAWTPAGSRAATIGGAFRGNSAAPTPRPIVFECYAVSWTSVDHYTGSH